uniref:Uncharacterized protein n=1 Tax=Chromera velia CCMP2878 TaxID=1169474 RepID=A0A0G4HWR6_9ALVE|eukprot:Cvel_9106.t1-p1 / transcript=Cvel_9106.t1 / gene=Cvel_9106 / organism=Chromera_velia_CCMP2878 / gene_product=hypothetical protein / transcript_product=hypothetical protein / location=Cvel_scaffold517:26312-27993(-) / protein_length=360 / sequence_SO=supercontig / SO=protein_coding / is_pseudo=false
METAHSFVQNAACGQKLSFPKILCGKKTIADFVKVFQKVLATGKLYTAAYFKDFAPDGTGGVFGFAAMFYAKSIAGIQVRVQWMPDRAEWGEEIFSQIWSQKSGFLNYEKKDEGGNEGGLQHLQLLSHMREGDGLEGDVDRGSVSHGRGEEAGQSNANGEEGVAYVGDGIREESEVLSVFLNGREEDEEESERRVEVQNRKGAERDRRGFRKESEESDEDEQGQRALFYSDDEADEDEDEGGSDEDDEDSEGSGSQSESDAKIVQLEAQLQKLMLQKKKASSEKTRQGLSQTVPSRLYTQKKKGGGSSSNRVPLALKDSVTRSRTEGAAAAAAAASSSLSSSQPSRMAPTASYKSRRYED